MNSKKRKIKEKMLLAVVACFLFASCGGGGGGGGGGSSNVTVRPTNPTTPTNPTNPTTSSGITVAVLDSDFLSHKAFLENKYSNIAILNRDSSITNPLIENNIDDNHGVTVLEVLRENASFGVVAASIGAKDSNGDETITPTAAIYKAALAKMDSNKVKIFNQSFGTVKTMMDPDFSNLGSMTNRWVALGGSLSEGVKILSFYEDTVKNKNGIFVWASGNDEVNHASLEGGLPYYNSDLERGWINVVGVNPDDHSTGKININNYEDNGGNQHRLAYAGNAKWWSISASFRSVEKRIVNSDGSITLTWGVGSSYATPRVSRAAALVAEKFPWMTNDQVRQTLFTTTDQTEITSAQAGTRRTENTPDTKYGWGMLNTTRALNGPGAFIKTVENGDNSLFSADIPSGTTSTFSNNIWGTGKLAKLGAGTLTLNGNNSYTGGSNILAGTLIINKIHAGNVTVESAGTLVLGSGAKIGYNSNGTLINDATVNNSNIRKADVDNYGTVKFNGSGAIIGGVYNAHAGSTTQANFDSNVTVRRLAFNKDAILKVTASKYITTESQSAAIISAESVSGEIGEVTADGMRRASAKVAGGDVIVELSRENVVDYVGNVEEASKNVAVSVENVFNDLDKKVSLGIATDEELAMGASVQKMSRKFFSTASAKMTGEIYASAQVLTFAQAQNINRDLSNRLAGLDNLNLSTGEAQTWFSALGSDGKLRRNGYASADTHVVGGQFGVDKKFNDTTNLGVALAYSYANAKFNKYAGDSKSNMVGLSVYGKKEFNNNLYAAGRFGTSHISTKVKRELIDASGNAVQGDIKHDDVMTSLYLELGKKFGWLTPFVGYSNDYLRRGSFSESNAAWGIHADSKNYWSTNLLLGLRAEYTFDKYKFQSYITQAINVGKRDLTYEGHYTGNSTNQKFHGIKLAKNTTWVGAGIFREITSNFGIYGNIDFRFEDGKRADSVFSTGLQYKF